jgi:PTS system mannose-specific IIB component
VKEADVMVDIVLARIDDRLIHGQIMASWVLHTQAQKIIIVDDEVSNDVFLSKVIKMAAPPGIKVEIYSIKGAIHVLKEKFVDKEKVILLVKSPSTMYSLIEGGVKLKEINIGGMSAGPGKKILVKNIFVSLEEKEILKNILTKGIPVYLQTLPDDPKLKIDKYL